LLDIELNEASNRMQQNATELSPVQIQVIGLLAAGASTVDAAKQAGVDRATIYRWQENSAFIAEWNRIKSEQLRSMRAALRGIASQSVAVLRELMTNSAVNESVRLKTAVAVLQAVGAFLPEDIGPTDPETIRIKRLESELLGEIDTFGM
jgi:putative insertion element HTH domain-containing protein